MKRLPGSWAKLFSKKKKYILGVQRALIGDWHSDLDLLEWPHHEVAIPKDRITEVARELSQLRLHGKKGK